MDFLNCRHSRLFCMPIRGSRNNNNKGLKRGIEQSATHNRKRSPKLNSLCSLKWRFKGDLSPKTSKETDESSAVIYNSPFNSMCVYNFKLSQPRALLTNFLLKPILTCHQRLYFLLLLVQHQ